MMNRRNFLKLSLVTTAGMIVPLTLISKNEVHKGETLTIKLITDKGDMFFKVPFTKSYDDGILTWKNIGNIEFEAKEDISITNMYVSSPVISGEWLKFDTFSNYPRRLMDEDILHIEFHDSKLELMA